MYIRRCATACVAAHGPGHASRAPNAAWAQVIAAGSVCVLVAPATAAEKRMEAQALAAAARQARTGSEGSDGGRQSDAAPAPTSARQGACACWSVAGPDTRHVTQHLLRNAASERTVATRMSDASDAVATAASLPSAGHPQAALAADVQQLELGPGDHFGELSLMDDLPRCAYRTSCSRLRGTLTPACLLCQLGHCGCQAAKRADQDREN